MKVRLPLSHGADLALILDSGVLYALLDRPDTRHIASRDLVMNFEELLILPLTGTPGG